MAVCRYHPDRPGIGVCMRCRVVICAGCCTRLDGVNHCHACLKVLGRRASMRPPADLLAPVVSAVLMGTCWFLFFFVFWFLQGTLAP